MRLMLFSTSAGVALLCAGAAGAQQTGPPPQAAAPQVAEQCLADLQTFTEKLAESGYGIVGPPGYGTPAGGAPAGGYGAGAPVGGWYGTQGARRGMGAIVTAAEVFAMRGKEDSCQTVLDEARKLHQERVQMIKEAGIAPEEVQTWRHEQLLTAVPVTEIEHAISVDSAIGAEVRNMKTSTSVRSKTWFSRRMARSSTLLSRGGLLGLGEEHVPVSWQELQAVPRLGRLRARRAEARGGAGAADGPPSVLRPADVHHKSEEIDRYWQQHAAG